MLTIDFAKKLIDAENRCNFVELEESCNECPYQYYFNNDKVYECIDKKAEDIIRFLKEWIDHESHRLD